MYNFNPVQPNVRDYMQNQNLPYNRYYQPNYLEMNYNPEPVTTYDELEPEPFYDYNNYPIYNQYPVNQSMGQYRQQYYPYNNYCGYNRYRVNQPVEPYYPYNNYCACGVVNKSKRKSPRRSPKRSPKKEYNRPFNENY